MDAPTYIRNIRNIDIILLRVFMRQRSRATMGFGCSASRRGIRKESFGQDLSLR